MISLSIQQKQTKKNVLRVENLSKVYNSGEDSFHATKNINLEIYDGDFTVIMGSSGSGKSTLLYLLSGLDSPTEGDIYFKNERIDTNDERAMAQFRATKIGYVYQSINLLPDLSLFENIAFPGYISGRTKGEVRSKALSLMSSLDIDKQKNRLPSQVSGGQQQRAAIARALINSPEVVFADEPTGALNVQQGEIILDILTELNKKGQSIVMVTHDMKAACRADRLILIKDGMIDSILELSKYKPETMVERERKVYSFVFGKES
ncbi:ABC transporter ATP-binding protein [Paenibacillus albidus]|uniref:ABC transporter ATP-binding protein n=1 Tax=Paenibacillus albidus TaxID=2041023 RepID=A0A917FMR9_9BACL|nr:ABC transporter ATP-binding protein [Paenibacillus albidus]GGF89903.1 ABC transporter ATP-binding protein [Paenibacillus albidus]